MNKHDLLGSLDSIERANQHYLNLSANENILSKTAQHYLDHGTAPNRYYFEASNNEYADFPEFVAAASSELDELVATSKSCLGALCGAGYVNLNPLSGIHAMLMTILSLTERGDAVASLRPQNHGHFATKDLVERIGRESIFLPMNGSHIDVVAVSNIVKHSKVKLIYIDAMSYTQPFNIYELRRAVGDNVIIVFDASHTLGLIIGGQFQSPLSEGADIMCGNTHKTFPGPHRGIIVADNLDIGDVIESKSSSLYSSVHYNSLLALLVTIGEMSEYAVPYAASVIRNAQTLQTELVQNKLIDPSRTLTASHQVHIIKPTRDEALDLVKKLRNQNVLTHMCFNGDSGYFVRIGTQEITRRGMGGQEMRTLAHAIQKIACGDDARLDIQKLHGSFQNVLYSFDETIYS